MKNSPILKNSLVLALLIICLNTITHAQWTWKNPIPPPNHYKSIEHITGQTYVTVGESLILKTEDGGDTWMQTEHPPVTGLNKVVFLDAETGFAVGENGNFLKSSDGGDSWEKVDTDTDATFYDVFFVNEQLGFLAASSGRIFKTTDGGQNWSLTELPDIWERLISIKFFDENTGYVTGRNGVFAKTTNGGEDWEIIEEQLSFYYIYDMHLIDAQTILLAAWGGIFKSTDGGEEWEEKLVPEHDEMQAFSFVSDNTGFALGDLSRIFKTTDGGESWTDIELLYAYFLCNLCEKGIAFESEHKGIVVGWENITQLDLQENTYNTPVQTITSRDIRDAAFTNDTTIVAVGAGVIARSNTNGRTWTILETTGSYHKVHFIDEHTGFAVGNIIVKTEDGGNSWELVLTPEEELRGVHFADADTGYAVGVGGVIYKTTNGGEDWLSKTSGVDVQLNSVFFTDADTGYASGSSGTIIQTTDGGDTWTTADTPTTSNLFSIYFLNDTIGFASVRGHGMVKTINAGDNWTWMSLPGSGNRIMRDMVFISEQDGYLAGSDYVFTTHDGGKNWELNFLPGNPSILGLAVRNDNTVIAVGWKGAILRKYTGPEEFPLDDEDIDAPLANAATELSPFGFRANWEDVAGADNYLLYVSADDFENHLIDGLEIAETDYVIESASPETEYKYRVKAANQYGVSEFSNEITVVTLTLPSPDTPVAIEATEVGSSAFTANWEAADYAAGYYLYVSTDEFTTHIDGYEGLDISGLSHEVSGLEPETSYKYRVKSYNDTDDSDFSNIIKVTTLAFVIPDEPVALNATDITQTGFTANWEAADNADGYMLFVSDDNFATHLDGYGGKDITELSEEITGLDPETSYKYRLKAYNEDGESEFSNTIEVTTDDTDTSVNSNTEASIFIYPNPAQNHITIEGVESKSTVEIFSIKGAKMMHLENPSKNITLDVSSLENGIYIIKISSENGVVSRKVFISR